MAAEMDTPTPCHTLQRPGELAGQEPEPDDYLAIQAALSRDMAPNQARSTGFPFVFNKIDASTSVPDLASSFEFSRVERQNQLPIPGSTIGAG